MSKLETELIDSQFIVDNISFLDKCFDLSFGLQSSLQVVKQYAAEQVQYEEKRNSFVKSKNNYISQNTTINYTRQLDSQSRKTSRKLKDWGLPPEIVIKYKDRGITEMFDWQVACLGNSKVLFECCNLVYSAPTSAGKTLVAEILAIKTILERQKKVIIILPFVSIVREKMFYLQNILSSSGIRVEGFMGCQSPPGGLQAIHVAICTIEKANSLINRLLDEGNISDLGAIIVDELHLLGDPHRGYILELLLTKIKYICSKSEDLQIQIVGMSATLPNLEVLANWLNAQLFITQYRPIPLDEYCLIGNKVYDKLGKCVNFIDSSLIAEGDIILKICLETIKDGCSILIFCMTKSWCENLAQSIAMSFYKLGSGDCNLGSLLRYQLNSENILEVLEQLKNCPVGLDQVLKKTISFGVSYHHAGLTFDERDIIEGGFKSGAIRVLVATSTLSSGVNLPARKVIIRSPVFQRQPINILTYKQMIGRAGRMGKDTKGESILVCTETEKKIGFDLMMGTLDPVRSCIESEDKYMRAVLEMIASQVLCRKEELDLYSKCTLLYTQQDMSPSQNVLLENTLKELKNFELVRVQTDGAEEHYVATPLGKACLSSSMAPNDGLSLFCELQKARQCLVLETDLHLIYLVTPYSVSSQWGEIDWLHLLTLWESLTKAMKRVGELVGIQESFIICCLRGYNKSNNVQTKVNIHKRFYTALALQDLVNEVPLSEVATKFQCARGFLQSLQHGAATFAGMVTAFCRQLGWKNMEMLVSQFQDRLHFGIHSDLIELMKLPSLNGMRARVLFDAGFETISSIAAANVNIIENILHKAIPFQSEKAGEDDRDDVRKRNKVKSIWITGCCGMTTKEAAENLISEARKYLVHEIGVSQIMWDSNKVVNKCDFANSGHSNIVKNSEQEFIHSNERNICTTSLECEVQNKRTPLINCTISNFNEIIPVNNHFKEQVESKPQNDLKPTVPINTVISLCHENYFLKGTKLISNKGNEILDSSTNFENYTKTASYSKCSSEKDDVVWDSLNLTDMGIDNITRYRTSEKMFSPNISFGENEEKFIASDNVVFSKCNSTKDISLFSSEADNSSLFEESLPLDLIPSKLLDKESTIMSKPETTSDHISIKSNTILVAFKSPLVDTDNGEDIKIVSGDGNERTEDNVTIDNSKNVSDVNTILNNFINPLKRRRNFSKEIRPVTKRNKIEKVSRVKSTLQKKSYILEPKLKSLFSKTFKIESNKFKMNCYLLRDDDILENLHILYNTGEVSIYLDINKSTLLSNDLIGAKVVNISKSVLKAEAINVNDFMKGIAMYLSEATCIYLDLTSFNCMKRLKHALCTLLFKIKTKIKLFCSKTGNLYIKRWLNVNLPANCTDILLVEWLINNDENIPNIDYLISKTKSRRSLQTVNFTESLLIRISLRDF